MLRLHPNIVAPGYYKTENTFYAEDQLYEKGDWLKKNGSDIQLKKFK